MSKGRSDRSRGFTLLELIAAVALLVLLGSMLFHIFTQASATVRIGNGRQEVFQFARAMFETLEAELPGVIGYEDAGPDLGGTPFRVLPAEAALASSPVPLRGGSDTTSFVSALIGRDTIVDSKTFGQTTNSAYVAYWLGAGDGAFILSRYESYDVNPAADAGRGWEFAVNVLEFRIECLDQWASPVVFKRMTWDSNATDTPDGARRGIPDAVRVTLRLTDKAHIGMYEYDAVNKRSKFKEGFSEEDDPMVQEFRQVIRMKKSH